MQQSHGLFAIAELLVIELDCYRYSSTQKSPASVWRWCHVMHYIIFLWCHTWRHGVIPACILGLCESNFLPLEYSMSRILSTNVSTRLQWYRKYVHLLTIGTVWSKTYRHLVRSSFTLVQRFEINQQLHKCFLKILVKRVCNLQHAEEESPRINTHKN